MNIDLKTKIIFYNIMSFSVSNRNNIEGDTIISGDNTISEMYGVFSLFGDLFNAFKGQTIRYDGRLWSKSEKKTFL